MRHSIKCIPHHSCGGFLLRSELYVTTMRRLSSSGKFLYLMRSLKRKSFTKEAGHAIFDNVYNGQNSPPFFA